MNYFDREFEPKAPKIEWEEGEKKGVIREVVLVASALVALFVLEKLVERYAGITINFLTHHDFQGDWNTIREFAIRFYGWTSL